MYGSIIAGGFTLVFLNTLKRQSGEECAGCSYPIRKGKRPRNCPPKCSNCGRNMILKIPA